jgi:hypothetical protein
VIDQTWFLACLAGFVLFILKILASFSTIARPDFKPEWREKS